MRLIIMPQAFKNVLPALVNEMIVLIKETAIIGYIGEQDLTKAAMVIQSRTFEAFIPLITAAVIYLALVMLLTFLTKMRIWHIASQSRVQMFGLMQW